MHFIHFVLNMPCLLLSLIFTEIYIYECLNLTKIMFLSKILGFSGEGPTRRNEKVSCNKVFKLEHLASNLEYSWDKMKPPTKSGEKNPVVELEWGMAKVLCLACYGKNDQDFKFCKFCATEAGEGCPGSLGSRVLGTTGIIGIHLRRRLQKKEHGLSNTGQTSQQIRNRWW